MSPGAIVSARDFTDHAEPHIQTMLRLARRLGQGEAEDIVQDSLARAWSKRNQYRPERGTFRSWLLAITADQAYKTWRRRRRHDRLVPPKNPEPQRDEVLDLEQSLRRLPARQRLAIDCYYFAGLSVGETAEVMWCSEGTVKSTLSSARAALKHLLR
jgi:RNA polymerase sigma-70 factor (ECF subfamily)